MGRFKSILRTTLIVLAVLIELKTVHIELKNDNINLAANMLIRLNLILTGMDNDLITAQADLGLPSINLHLRSPCLLANNNSRRIL